jgi:tetratricopeptide (TPR) repeat protein
LLLAALAPSAHAHGELDRQIAEVTERIRRSPKEATLYLQRAELHRQHGDPEAAFADLAQTRKLDPRLADADFTEGRVHSDVGRLAEARSAFDRFLAARPDHPIALWHRAQALIKLDQRPLAEADLKRCLEVVQDPTPELFLARATNLERMNQSTKALAVLDAGVKQLGALPVLQLSAADLLARTGKHAEALARLEQLMLATPQSAPLLLRKGRVQTAAGDIAGARESFLAARSVLAKLSPTRQQTAANRELAAQIDAALRELDYSPPIPERKSVQPPP